MWNGELGPKTREERETYFCEDTTELPVLLEPKQLAKVTESHEERKTQSLILRACLCFYL